MRAYERSGETTPTELSRMMDEMEGDIARQLLSCPRSLIVLDDIERLSSSFLDFLQGPLHEHYPVASYRSEDGVRKEVSTRDAVFILISDLNEDRLSPDLPRKTAIEYIRAKARERWGDIKVVNFIQRTVPFVPLSNSEMKNVAEVTLKKLESAIEAYSGGKWKGKVTWQADVVDRVVAAAKEEYTDANARGVGNWVDVEVVDRLREAWESEHAKTMLRTHRHKGQEDLVFTSFNLVVDSEGQVNVESYGQEYRPPPPLRGGYEEMRGTRAGREHQGSDL